MKDVPVSKEVWQMLRKIRDEKNLKHLNQVVKLLMEQYFIEEKTIENEEQGEVNVIEDQPPIYDIDDETVGQPVEKIDRADDRFSIDRKTLGRRLQINKNTNLRSNKTNPYATQHPITGTGGRLRQRLYARKQQSFPEENTLEGVEEKTNITDEKTSAGKQKNRTITDDRPIVSNKVIETTVQPVEEVLKLHITEDTNLPLDRTSSCTNQAQFLGKAGRLRRRLDTRKQ